MKYRVSDGTNVLSKFPTGSTVTIALYKITDESAVALTSNSCNEIATTGVFKWNSSNITAQPTALTEYLWVATDTISSQYGKLVLLIDEVWTAPTATDYGANTMGELVKDDLTDALANLAIVDGIVDAIKAKTDNLPSDPADQSLLSDAIYNISGTASAIKAKTDQLIFTIPNQVNANVLSGVPTAVDVRTEMDNNSTKLADILTDTGTTIPATITTIDGIVDSILVDTGTDIPALIANIDADVLAAIVEGTFTVQDILKFIAGVLAGKSSGGGTGTVTFRDLSDALNRIVATVDANGNRTLVIRNNA